MTTEAVNQRCAWYISIEKPECGDPAVATVKVNGKTTQATVPLCEDHKAEHDNRFAALRNRSKHTPARA